jgi:hypothetical protein
MSKVNITGKRPKPGPRVYGTALVGGVRHEASGVIDGTFAKEKGGWDSNTTCGIGSYGGAPVETDPDLYVTCIQCLGKRRPTGSILRGKTADMTILDEAQDFSPTQMMDLINEVGEKVVAGATRSYGGILSGPPSPSLAAPRASRRC